MAIEVGTKGRDAVDVGVLSHVGMVRSENQDHFAFSEPEADTELARRGRLMVVCDGMGGHNGGTVASRTAVDAVVRGFLEGDHTEPRPLLAAAIAEANRLVTARGRSDPALRNMGTTCVALLVRGVHAEIAHIGDSRAYLVREGTVRALTRDHTYINELIDYGLLTEEEAATRQDRHVITRCVGMGERLETDFQTVAVKPGDTFVLCSDGLYQHVHDREIRDHVLQHGAQGAAQSLIDLANERGGEDNITVGVFKLAPFATFDGPERSAGARSWNPDDTLTMNARESLRGQPPRNEEHASAPETAEDFVIQVETARDEATGPHDVRPSASSNGRRRVTLDGAILIAVLIGMVAIAGLRLLVDHS